MLYDQTYQTYIRFPDGSIGCELFGVTHLPQEGDIQKQETFLIDETGTRIGYKLVSYDPSAPDTDLNNKNTMPEWWKAKSWDKIEKLIKQFDETGVPVPASYNVVTAGMHRRNGAMMGQLRSFVSPAGKPIGNPGMPSMHGGLIEAEDLNLKDTDVEGDYKAGCLMAVCREMEEEFGVNMHWDDFEYLGDIYDPDNSRCNHIYQVTTPYEDLVIRNHIRDLSPALPLHTQQLIIAAIEASLSTVLECEGVGRITNMFKEDCERAMEIVGLTPISISILQAFPQLIPPPRPAAE